MTIASAITIARSVLPKKSQVPKPINTPSIVPLAAAMLSSRTIMRCVFDDVS